MGEIVKFEIGCTHCENLAQTGKNTYVCLKRMHKDGSDVLPIKDGKKTKDWAVCKGKNYVRTLNICKRRRAT